MLVVNLNNNYYYYYDYYYYCYHPPGCQPTRPWFFRVTADMPLVLLGASCATCVLSGATRCTLAAPERHSTRLWSFWALPHERRPTPKDAVAACL